MLGVLVAMLLLSRAGSVDLMMFFSVRILFRPLVLSLWWEVVTLRGKQYALPNRNLGTCFVNISEEIELCTEGREQSERELIHFRCTYFVA